MIEATKLQLEINQSDANPQKQSSEKIIDTQRVLDNDFQLIWCGPAKRENVLWRYNWIAKTVIFQAKFTSCCLMLRPLLAQDVGK